MGQTCKRRAAHCGTASASVMLPAVSCMAPMSRLPGIGSTFAIARPATAPSSRSTAKFIVPRDVVTAITAESATIIALPASHASMPPWGRPLSRGTICYRRKPNLISINVKRLLWRLLGPWSNPNVAGSTSWGYDGGHSRDEVAIEFIADCLELMSPESRSSSVRAKRSNASSLILAV
jgi:hypothetical protein